MNIFIHLGGQSSAFTLGTWQEWKGKLDVPIDRHILLGNANFSFLRNDPSVDPRSIIEIDAEDNPENGPRHISRSYCVLEAIEQLGDVGTVFCPLGGGVLFSLVNAKRVGFAERKIRLVALRTGTMRSASVNEASFFGTYEQLCAEYMESYVALFADECLGEGPVPEQVAMLKRRSDVASARQHPPRPRIDVIITHYNRSDVVKHTLDAYQVQTYKDFAITVIDDGSKEEHYEALVRLVASYNDLNVRVVRKENGYLGAARNHGAKITDGDFVIFNDDDNIPMPRMIEHMIRGMEATGADVITSAMRTFEYKPGSTDIRYLGDWYYLGGAMPAALYDNSLGDANSIYRRSVFDEVQFHTHRGVGHEDFEFFARALLKGKHIETITQPIFYYRKDPSSMINTTVPYKNLQRHISAFQELDSSEVRSILVESALAYKLQKASFTLTKQVKSQLKTVYMRMPKAMRFVVRKGFQAIKY